MRVVWVPTYDVVTPISCFVIVGCDNCANVSHLVSYGYKYELMCNIIVHFITHKNSVVVLLQILLMLQYGYIPVAHGYIPKILTRLNYSNYNQFQYYLRI